ncbi:hypothetical protein BP6252_08239 [Coleophoma cylindrospora]|uniref:Uncharacterized protein n=1 Tax=Coleophoma cylindrospora TaxID=1849047 RepID=A0A3D8R5A7_9HELO|nr:hypothetical protein BP6252_08239 [Coleophoma cylindrospora]
MLDRQTIRKTLALRNVQRLNRRLRSISTTDQEYESLEARKNNKSKNGSGKCAAISKRHNKDHNVDAKNCQKAATTVTEVLGTTIYETLSTALPSSATAAVSVSTTPLLSTLATAGPAIQSSSSAAVASSSKAVVQSSASAAVTSSSMAVVQSSTSTTIASSSKAVAQSSASTTVTSSATSTTLPLTTGSSTLATSSAAATMSSADMTLPQAGLSTLTTSTIATAALASASSSTTVTQTTSGSGFGTVLIVIAVLIVGAIMGTLVWRCVKGPSKGDGSKNGNAQGNSNLPGTSEKVKDGGNGSWGATQGMNMNNKGFQSPMFVPASMQKGGKDDPEKMMHTQAGYRMDYGLKPNSNYPPPLQSFPQDQYAIKHATSWPTDTESKAETEVDLPIFVPAPLQIGAVYDPDMRTNLKPDYGPGLESYHTQPMPVYQDRTLDRRNTAWPDV